MINNIIVIVVPIVVALLDDIVMIIIVTIIIIIVMMMIPMVIRCKCEPSQLQYGERCGKVLPFKHQVTRYDYNDMICPFSNAKDEQNVFRAGRLTWGHKGTPWRGDR